MPKLWQNLIKCFSRSKAVETDQVFTDRELTDIIHNKYAERYIKERNSLKSNFDPRLTINSNILSGDSCSAYQDILEIKHRQAHTTRTKIVDLTNEDKPHHIRDSLLIALYNNGILRNLDTKQHEALVKVMKKVNLEAGETVIEEGALGRTMYILLDGVVKKSFEKIYLLAQLYSLIIIGLVFDGVSGLVKI